MGIPSFAQISSEGFAPELSPSSPRLSPSSSIVDNSQSIVGASRERQRALYTRIALYSVPGKEDLYIEIFKNYYYLLF